MTSTRLAAVFLAVSFAPSLAFALPPGPNCPPPAPDVEPNDTLAAASPITRPMPGLLAPSNGRIDPAGDVDHFRVHLEAGERLWLLVDTGVSTTGYYASFLQIVRPDGTVLASDWDEGTALFPGTQTVASEDASTLAGVAVPTTGDYFIRIKAAEAGMTFGYRLITAVSPNASSPEVEPNDSTPMTIAPGISVLASIADGDVDRYRLGLLDVGLPFVIVDSIGAVNLELTIGSLVVDSSHIAGSEAVMPGPTTGDFALRRLDGVSLFEPYRVALFYTGETCELPVALQSFEVR